ncbi:Clp protease ClpB [Litoribacter ruber]|uniref:Clp protease ClpB n=1 Tax=Litoribacter ruber TaxID=702568 RepID=A0AAP2CGF6_9BACT|nr:MULTISPECIES: Clp protease ClpB [Litoribacter]MBS9523622.1 Clp protease ClpB [Litoribacter alkaliphilus]MBT0812136.1 Clp protease ClpB [Litoribacter ruber]
MKTILTLLLITLPFLGMAQEKLNRLVQEREQLHQQWRESEGQKSGIFGNRTKKDMIQTNEWMERIIQKDNQIMNELKMLGEIQRVEVIHEKDDYKYIAQKQEQDIGRLKRALADMENSVQEKREDKRTYEWTTLIFFITTLVFGVLFFRKLRS